ncbi:fumarylacetoacetate hydrolase family protein [Alphaproteobacteria bacterium]|nr:fumarylacetoacetate hydrolase family protein [Alphaproteobacteria bacterium]
MNYSEGCFVGRIWDSAKGGPCLVTIKGNYIYDITSKEIPTIRDLLELKDINEYLESCDSTKLVSTEQLLQSSLKKNSGMSLLAPCDFQAIKACGVTFAKSMVERVIEERAAGDPKKAESLRNHIGGLIGDSLQNIIPGSEKANEVKKALISEGLWSQYLEVGIGKDAEVFTKAQTLSSVGYGAEVGLNPISNWNNPEPEIVLAVNSNGIIQGATLGNDVNLRDVEGRSALLLGKAKDNNASCSIGPFIRIFNESYTLEDMKSAHISLKVEGKEGYILNGSSSMSEISRDPEDLVSQTIGRHHQYPDGFMLFLGTLFAPTEDRDVVGEGFTHKIGDMVTISEPNLGELINFVNLSTVCPQWEFGISSLIKNLSQRDLL